MNKVFLHIGFHKTASSSFQETGRHHADDLARQGFLYPVFECVQDGRKIHNHSVPVFSAFTEEPADYHVNILTDVREVNRVNASYREQLRTALDSGRNVILSGEDISQLSERGLRALSEFIRQSGVKLVPIALVRSPYEYHCSSAQQVVNGGNRVEFTALMSQRNKIERILRVFADDILLFSFGEALQHARGPVGFLFERMGVDTDRIEPIRTNERRSNGFTRVQNELNRLQPSISKADNDNPARTRNRNHIRLKDPGGDKFLLTGKELAAIKPSLDAENAYFRKRLGEPFCDSGFAVDEEPDLAEVAKIIHHSFDGFLFNLSQETINYIRNLAIHHESRDPDLALELMTLAHLARPEGPLIAQKLAEMKKAAVERKKP